MAVPETLAAVIDAHNYSLMFALIPRELSSLAPENYLFMYVVINVVQSEVVEEGYPPAMIISNQLMTREEFDRRWIFINSAGATDEFQRVQLKPRSIHHLT